MSRDKIDHLYGNRNLQIAIDISYGLLIITPLLLSVMDIGYRNELVLFTIGIGVGYILHVVNKVVVFNQLLDTAEEAINEEVEERAEEVVEEEVEQQIEDGI